MSSKLDLLATKNYFSVEVTICQSLNGVFISSKWPLDKEWIAPDRPRNGMARSDVDYHLMKRRTYEWWCFPPHIQGKCFHCRDRSVNHKQHPGWIAGFFIHIPTSGGWRGKCNLAKGCMAKMQGCITYKREAKHSQQCTTVCYSHYYLFMHNWARKKTRRVLISQKRQKW